MEQEVRFDGGSLVTVIITSFNSAGFIHKAIHSVLAQTHSNWELLVVDDGSTDNTVSIAKSILDKCARARVIARSSNSGLPSVVRNIGAHEAKGRYVAFLDADDTWRPRKLARQLQVMNNCQQAVGVHSQMLSVVQSGKWTLRSLQSPKQKHASQESLRKGNTISLSSVLVRAKALRQVGGFSELPGLCGFEDYELWLRISQIGSFAYCPEIHGRYLVRTGSLSDGQSQLLVHRFLSENLKYQVDPPLPSLSKPSRIVRIPPRVIRNLPTNLYHEALYRLNLKPKSN